MFSEGVPVGRFNHGSFESLCSRSHHLAGSPDGFVRGHTASGKQSHCRQRVREEGYQRRGISVCGLRLGWQGKFSAGATHLQLPVPPNICNSGPSPSLPSPECKSPERCKFKLLIFTDTY